MVARPLLPLQARQRRVPGRERLRGDDDFVGLGVQHDVRHEDGRERQQRRGGVGGRHWRWMSVWG